MQKCCKLQSLPYLSVQAMLSKWSGAAFTDGQGHPNLQLVFAV